MADTLWRDTPREISDGIYQAAIHYRHRILTLGEGLDDEADTKLAAYLDWRSKPPPEADEEAQAA